MTPAELFTRCGKALFGDGPSWKAQCGHALGIRTDSVDAMAKGDSRVPPGAWLDLARLIQDRERDLPAVKVAVLDAANLPPLGAIVKSSEE